MSLRLLALELPDIFGRVDVSHPSLRWRATSDAPANPAAAVDGTAGADGAGGGGGNRSHPYLRTHMLANDYAVFDAERARLYRRARRAGLVVVPAG